MSAGENKYKQLVENFNNIPFRSGLYLKGVDFPYKGKRIDFLLYFFSDYNKNCETYEGNKLVTDTKHGYGRNRSIQELYFIMTTYFPGYQLKQFFIDFYEIMYKVNTDIETVQKSCFNSRDTTFNYNLIHPNCGILLHAMWCPDVSRSVIAIIRYPIASNEYSGTEIFPVYGFSAGNLSKTAVKTNCEVFSLMMDKELQFYLLGNKYYKSAEEVDLMLFKKL
jgi:hypothetical protein